MYSKPSRPRAGFTLVEMLVTTMVMLIMVLAISQMFALIGRHVTDGRALIELQGQVRTAGFRIQEDLDGLHVRTAPQLGAEFGYLEYIEGADYDLSDSDYTVGSDVEPWFITTAGVEVRPSYDSTDPTNPINGVRTAYGDIDDVLMFTVRSTGRPFVGRIRRSIITNNPLHHGQTLDIESQDAEVIYWTQWVDADGDNEIGLGEMTLHRRVLLIRPDLVQFDDPTNPDFPDNMPYFQHSANVYEMRPGDLQAFYNQSDLSVRPVEITRNGNQVVALMPNSLSDLARRENRVAHLPTTAGPNFGIDVSHVPLETDGSGFYPHRFNRLWLPQHFDDDPTSPASPSIGDTGLRAGEDIVQSDLLAFDVRVYDATAPIRQGGAAGSPTGDLLMPGDWGWDTALNPTNAAAGPRGAFVDLFYAHQLASSSISNFSGPPNAKSGMTFHAASNRPLMPTYDTWTWSYERDGFNQELPGVGYAVTGSIDEATNGIDDDNANGVDDTAERETMPPYPSPLRGLRVTLRVIELDTRQVRQTTVVSDFVPE